MSMGKTMEAARKRRAKILAEYDRRGGKHKVGLAARMAEKYAVSPARMSQLLIQARKDLGVVA